ncbi:MAG: ATP-binding cassette domain-containing protein [Candidatus Magasanikbacteria bacterium]|nr:ATP-binding cassette domain-containing protein [Candidatus Magasanikbacteria bacterium]
MNFLRQSTVHAGAGIAVRGISKHFGNVRALDSVDLVVEPGSVTALLGPNGAGKTTLVRVLTTLLQPDAGTATVAGFDSVKDAKKLRSHMSLAGQSVAIDEHLTGRENLELVGRLYHLGKKAAKARAQELLAAFDLTDAADRRAKTYSGGMRRRLDLGASLVAHPEILFLDEPTTGLDPRSRQALWKEIEALAADGVTILLTTQYMEEADTLADRIAVIDHGHIIAEGSPAELKARIGGDEIEIMVVDHEKTPAAALAVAPFGIRPPEMDIRGGRVLVPVESGVSVLAPVIRRLDDAHIAIADIALRRPTLDDVFLRLTGHTAESHPEQSEGSREILQRGASE